MCRCECCRNCIFYKNLVKLFQEHCSLEEWNYICNFLNDYFRVSLISRQFFKDIFIVPNTLIDRTVFSVSSNPEHFKSKKVCKRIYYVNSNKKFDFSNC